MRHVIRSLVATTLLLVPLGCTPKVAVEVPKEPITVNLNVKLDADVRHHVEKVAARDVGDDSIFSLAAMNDTMDKAGAPLLQRIDTAPKSIGFSETPGERYDGFVVPRKEPPSKSAQALAGRINAERSALYEKRAKETNAPVGAVGIIYAEEIAKTAPKGTYFLDGAGKWEKK